MTDQEINHAVDVRLHGTSHKTRVLKDYCNNPSDAWPIILENRISMIAPDFFTDPKSGHGVGNFDSPMVRDKNPLRAAIIFYLMMGDNDE